MSDLHADGATAEPTRYEFQAEVKQLLDIVIHSLYSNREIFLRELISNAADALDKLRFRALTEPDLTAGDETLEIRIVPDADAKTLTIVDTGIGMSRDELARNLGTIAHSGSKAFAEALKDARKADDADGGDGGAPDLIGRFGVGFYSAFLVAPRVEVKSRAAGSDEAYVWSSTGDGAFTIAPTTLDHRGTEIVLHVADEHEEYLSEWRLRHLVERYSDYVGHPIKLAVKKDDDDEVALETINRAQALWRRPKAEIEDEQYAELYRHLCHDHEGPLAHTHFKIEGTRQFTGLLYIPRRPPFDLFDRDRRRGVRLYVKRVFIMDDCEELVPEWLRFLRGVIDSDDLPLNVSRELLQEEKAVKAIRQNVVKKALEMIEHLAEERPEDYAAFWEEYGAVLKEGLHFDPASRERLARLVRYPSSKEESTSLAAYVARMPEDQEAIYYAIGPSLNAVEGSPHLEALKKKGTEILYMIDPIDEWAMHGLTEFEGKKLVSAMKGDAAEDDAATADETKDEGGLIGAMKTTLADQVSTVRFSKRLTDSPACLVVPEGGAHAHIERLLRSRHKDMPATRRILEINRDHAVIRGLDALAADPARAGELREWVFLLYDQALLAEGSPIADPGAFARRMTKLMSTALPG